MMNAMMKRYEMIAVVGLIIVLVAFALAYVAAENTAFWLGAAKDTREAARAGSGLVAAKVSAETLRTWVSPFKFTGLALMLGAITMALGLILLNLKELGTGFMATWPERLRPEPPQPPKTVMMFRMAMMLGVLLVVVSLLVALNLVPTVQSYWSHSIAAELNPAEPGSALLAQLGFIRSQLWWINAIKFTGMALLFTGITLALTVIIRTLQTQEATLERFLVETRQ